MTVLITGGFGFVGSNLTTQLAASGMSVWILDLNDVKDSNLPCTRVFSWDDLSSIPWLEVDGIVHLAGIAHDTENTKDPDLYFAVNVGLTKKLLAAYSQSVAGKRKIPFIFFSSVKAVADHTSEPLLESMLPAPKTPYGKSKLQAEAAIMSSEYDKVIDAYILRPCMIHGPGNKGNLTLLYKLVVRGYPWPLGAYKNLRSFLSIDNVCSVVRALLVTSVPGGIYQVGDDEALSTNDLVSLMAEATGSRTKVYSVPRILVEFLAKAGDMLRLPLNSERLHKLTESYVVDNSKLKSALGWPKMPLDALSGIKKTLRSFQEI